MTAGSAPQHMQRARGAGRIDTAQIDGRTRLRTLYQEGCAKIRLPSTHDDTLQAVLINTAGGLTGGDDLTWQAHAAARSSLVLTTQACERLYKSNGPEARISARLTVGPGARLDWLPQETILFDRSRLTRTLEVDLAADARFLAVEAVILGREAMGEDARDVRLTDSWRIRRDGRLVHAEATRIAGDEAERDGPSLLDGARAFATLLYVGEDAGRRLDAVRALVGSGVRAGASLMGERLVIRAIASSGLSLRRIIVPVIASLSGAGRLPRLWQL